MNIDGMRPGYDMDKAVAAAMGWDPVGRYELSTQNDVAINFVLPDIQRRGWSWSANSLLPY